MASLSADPTPWSAFRCGNGSSRCAHASILTPLFDTCVWTTGSIHQHPLLPPLYQTQITQYAERLESDLEGLEWPEGTMTAQRLWIGRSEGAKVIFPLPGHGEGIEVFTTRPDTLMGVTYVVLAPEHPLVKELTTPAQKGAVDAYVKEAAGKSDLDRSATGKDKGKTGVFTGATAVHPITGEPVPVWVADYVLWGYGTGAVMAVPAHDERDWAFAKVRGSDRIFGLCVWMDICVCMMDRGECAPLPSRTTNATLPQSQKHNTNSASTSPSSKSSRPPTPRRSTWRRGRSAGKGPPSTAGGSWMARPLRRRRRRW